MLCLLELFPNLQVEISQTVVTTIPVSLDISPQVVALVSSVSVDENQEVSLQVCIILVTFQNG